MSILLDSDSYVAGGILLTKYSGLGILAEDIPSTGTDGASFLYNDVSLPTDNGKEIRALITSYPATGTLTIYEDGSFIYVGGADGNNTFTYDLYVDGILTTSNNIVTLTVGEIAQVILNQVSNTDSVIGSITITKTVRLTAPYEINIALGFTVITTKIKSTIGISNGISI